MNIKSIIAFLMAGTVFFVGVFTSTKNPMAFVDFHAALIVFGGTVAVAAISFQVDRIFLMMKVFYLRVVKNSKTNYVGIISELMTISEAYRTNDPKLKNLVENTNDYFIRETMGILLDDFLDQEELRHILSLRAQTMAYRYREDAKKFKALGKFPPAMGLMGAVLGMIALLQTLGQPGAEEQIGPAMAVALVATLYGIAFANLVVIPIAENLMDGAGEVMAKNTMIVEGVMLIAQRKNKILVAEELNSYLLPNERLNWKDIEGARV
ncbi:MAG: MotA/TolQ/ExbB proton channel family protein [Bdellovibrionaceae bacterium]|nr:MotA/TolQ/ExbB proton channel family protein [Pseudobdellovibrionaceae bacterium]